MSHKLLNYYHFISGRSGRFKRLLWISCTCSRKTVRFRTRVPIQKLSTQSSLQALEVCNWNFRHIVFNALFETSKSFFSKAVILSSYGNALGWDMLSSILCVYFHVPAVIPSSFFRCYLSFSNIEVTPHGTYDPNAHGSDACRGSNKLWTRTLNRYTRADPSSEAT